jgi:hypothetical protein
MSVNKLDDHIAHALKAMVERNSQAKELAMPLGKL